MTVPDFAISDHRSTLHFVAHPSSEAASVAQLGETDRALDLLEAWIGQVGPDMKLWFKNDSDFDPIRDHPRYQKLLELGGM